MMRAIVYFILLLSTAWSSPSDSNSSKDFDVKITKDIAYIDTIDTGKKVRIMRIQDTDYKLTDDYTKTSRLCPPFCIQPNHIEDGIQNIGELELLAFLKHDVKDNTGLLIDARLSNWYAVETIPSAMNLPFNIVEQSDKILMGKIFKVFGMRIQTDEKWDFSHVKKLAIFCNGVWCEQSKHLIDGLLKYGYPKDRILYYRGGFQGWKLLGLTTIIHSSKIQ